MDRALSRWKINIHHIAEVPTVYAEMSLHLIIARAGVCGRLGYMLMTWNSYIKE